MTQRALGLVHKLERAEVKILNAKEGRVLATVSTETKDRDGDIIRQAFWETDNFMRNPVLVDSHNYGSIERIFGHWASMEVKGKSLVGEVVYHLDSPNAHVAELAKQGLDLAHRDMAAYSVGFIPDMSKAVELKNADSFFPNYEFRGQELLEVSQVSVPANPDALQRMKGIHPAIDAIVDDIVREKTDSLLSRVAEIEALQKLGIPDDAINTLLDMKGFSISIDVNSTDSSHTDGTSDPVDALDDVLDAVGDQLDSKEVLERLDAVEHLLHTHDGVKELISREALLLLDSANKSIDHGKIIREAIREVVDHG